MPQVVVTIDGKTFRMACAEGEEPHLTELASLVDQRVAGLRQSFGEIGDQRLLVMAAIMTTDELAEQRRRIEALEQALAAVGRERQEALRRAEAGEERLIRQVTEAAEALERVAERLERRA